MMGLRRQVVGALVVTMAICAWSCSLTERQPLGGLEEISTSNPAVVRAAQFALSEFNKESNDIYVSKIARIVSAKQQLVAGVKYILEVELGRTQCRQGEVDDLESCEFHATPHKTHCNFEVLTVAWMEEISLIKNTCTPLN
ncbi:cystatin-like [Heptranchias perlo]|uniref:cystatin-like n=1 Tax=Heptranchias perlo TaxID=212740 RepID=UPI0035598C04